MKNITFWHSNIFQSDFIYKAKIKNSYKIPKIKNISFNICSKTVIENPKNLIYILLESNNNGSPRATISIFSMPLLQKKRKNIMKRRYAL